METMAGVPNIIRAVLLFASIVSFLPQYRRVISRGDTDGIAPYYLLFNLISVTEQFAISLHFINNASVVMDYIILWPLSPGDWLNFAQFAIVWLCHLVLFSLYIYYPTSAPNPGIPASSRASKVTVVIFYCLFLLISIVPVILEATLPPMGTDPNNDRRWFSAIYFNIHSLIVNPIVTALTFAALFPQMRTLRSRPEDGDSGPGALSIVGLGVQAVVFAVVALAWIFRFYMPRGMISRAFVSWYQLVGWSAVNNGLFAFVQALLWIYAKRRWGLAGVGSWGVGRDAERAPLLGR